MSAAEKIAESVIYGLPFPEYIRLPAVSAHGLMLIERSPMHYRASIEAPRAPTAAQALGTLTHLAVLEWDEYQRSVRVAPEADRRTKAGKEALAAFESECEANSWTVATPEQDAKARAMREAVMAQPFARALFADGHAEVTLRWRIGGADCKARPDWLCAGHDVIVDLKTAIDASPAAFAKASGNFKYHLQAAWYTDAAEWVGLGARAFVFIAVEPEPPHGVGLYKLDDGAIHAGRVRYQRALETYLGCKRTGDWPGYARDIQTIELPRWAL